MSYRIRVYPQGYGAAGGYGGYGAYGGRYYQQQLANERKVASLQLGYERALMQQQLQMAQLQAQAQYGGGLGMYGRGVVSPYGYGAAMLPGAGMMGGVPPQFGGRGQSNITNQSAMGCATQNVTNSNAYSNYSVSTGSPFGGMGFPFSGGLGGGMLGNLLGGWL